MQCVLCGALLPAAWDAVFLTHLRAQHRVFTQHTLLYTLFQLQVDQLDRVTEFAGQLIIAGHTGNTWGQGNVGDGTEENQDMNHDMLDHEEQSTENSEENSFVSDSNQTSAVHDGIEFQWKQEETKYVCELLKSQEPVIINTEKENTAKAKLKKLQNSTYNTINDTKKLTKAKKVKEADDRQQKSKDINKIEATNVFSKIDNDIFRRGNTEGRKKFFKSQAKCERECGITWTNDKEWFRHKRIEHDGYISCQFCSKTNKNQEILSVHLERRHSISKVLTKGNSTVCAECGYVGTNAANYRFHLACHHDNQTYVCDICSKTIKGKRNFKLHKRRAHVGPVKCAHCAKMVRNMSKHLKISHTADSDKKYPCVQCGKGFTDKTRYSEHQLTHDDLRPFPCQFACNAATKSAGNRRKHEQICAQKNSKGTLKLET